MGAAQAGYLSSGRTPPAVSSVGVDSETSSYRSGLALSKRKTPFSPRQTRCPSTYSSEQRERPGWLHLILPVLNSMHLNSAL